MHDISGDSLPQLSFHETRRPSEAPSSIARGRAPTADIDKPLGISIVQLLLIPKQQTASKSVDRS